MKHAFYLFVFFGLLTAYGQQDPMVLDFNEYMGYVKKFHPVAKQAALTIDMGQASLMKARGGFDPKIAADYDRKVFKNTEYYDRLNATFKIPTWFGIELKGTFEQNDGDFLNPADTVPADGLYSAGVSVPIGQGLWINDRMATLKQAKLFREQTQADRDLLVNQLLYEAAITYFDWLQAYQDTQVFGDFLENAKMRLAGVKKNAEVGEVAAIDTVEAKIAVGNRQLSLEQAKVRLTNKSLALSNFLWLGNNIPVEVQDNVVPGVSVDDEIDVTLEILGKPLDSFSIEKHPKLRSLGYKIDGLRVEKRLKGNKLLPKIDLEYNFLTETPELINSFQTEEYKGGINFQFPLFLRKERGDLKLAKIKLRDAELDLDYTEVQIRNKILAIYNELESFQSQNQLIFDIVKDYNTLLAAEERKFSFGESSLFLINSRETKLIEARLKQNAVQNKYFNTKAKLFNSLALNPENL